VLASDVLNAAQWSWYPAVAPCRGEPQPGKTEKPFVSSAWIIPVWVSCRPSQHFGEQVPGVEQTARPYRPKLASANPVGFFRDHSSRSRMSALRAGSVRRLPGESAAVGLRVFGEPIRRAMLGILVRYREAGTCQEQAAKFKRPANDRTRRPASVSHAPSLSGTSLSARHFVA